MNWLNNNNNEQTDLAIPLRNFSMFDKLPNNFIQLYVIVRPVSVELSDHFTKTPKVNKNNNFAIENCNDMLKVTI